MLLICPSCLENRNFSRSFPFLSPPFTLSSEGVGNNEAKAELCVIYINDYIAVSHLFAWASMVVLWKSYIIPVPLPRQLRGGGFYVLIYCKSFVAWIVQLHSAFCNKFELLITWPDYPNLYYIQLYKTFSYKSMQGWKCSGWKHFLSSKYVFIHN